MWMVLVLRRESAAATSRCCPCPPEKCLHRSAVSVRSGDRHDPAMAGYLRRIPNPAGTPFIMEVRRKATPQDPLLAAHQQPAQPAAPPALHRASDACLPRTLLRADSPSLCSDILGAGLLTTRALDCDAYPQLYPDREFLDSALTSTPAVASACAFVVGTGAHCLLAPRFCPVAALCCNAGAKPTGRPCFLPAVDCASRRRPRCPQACASASRLSPSASSSSTTPPASASATSRRPASSTAAPRRWKERPSAAATSSHPWRASPHTDIREHRFNNARVTNSALAGRLHHLLSV